MHFFLSVVFLSFFCCASLSSCFSRGGDAQHSLFLLRCIQSRPIRAPLSGLATAVHGGTKQRSRAQGRVIMASLSSFDEAINHREGQLAKLAASLQSLVLGLSKEASDVPTSSERLVFKRRDRQLLRNILPRSRQRRRRRQTLRKLLPKLRQYRLRRRQMRREGILTEVEVGTAPCSPRPRKKRVESWCSRLRMRARTCVDWVLRAAPGPSLRDPRCLNQKSSQIFFFLFSTPAANSSSYFLMRSCMSSLISNLVFRISMFSSSNSFCPAVFLHFPHKGFPALSLAGGGVPLLGTVQVASCGEVVGSTRASCFCESVLVTGLVCSFDFLADFPASTS